MSLHYKTCEGALGRKRVIRSHTEKGALGPKRVMRSHTWPGLVYNCDISKCEMTKMYHEKASNLFVL